MRERRVNIRPYGKGNEGAWRVGERERRGKGMRVCGGWERESGVLAGGTREKDAVVDNNGYNTRPPDTGPSCMVPTPVNTSFIPHTE